jgi:hypothetical protein
MEEDQQAAAHAGAGADGADAAARAAQEAADFEVGSKWSSMGKFNQ